MRVSCIYFVAADILKCYILKLPYHSHWTCVGNGVINGLKVWKQKG